MEEMKEMLVGKVEEKIKEIMSKEGINRESADYLYKLVDIHKDIKNEDYWNVKEEYYNEIRKLRCQKKR